jgi:hypothetical protein
MIHVLIQSEDPSYFAQIQFTNKPDKDDSPTVNISNTKLRPTLSFYLSIEYHITMTERRSVTADA